MNGNRQPEIIVFAGPNGSGKSTITKAVKTATESNRTVMQTYINADDIKSAIGCSDVRAATIADDLRKMCIKRRIDFSFETVLSTTNKIEFLRSAKSGGYFIRGYFVLTSDVEINVLRVHSRVERGGHGVPADKIRSRYFKSLINLPTFIELCDVCHIYDNTLEPFRIFKKRKSEFFVWENQFWNEKQISELTNIGFITHTE